MLLYTGLIVTAWWPTLSAMWLRWFPAWRTPDLSWIGRLTEGSSYYAHGPLVPVVSLLVALKCLETAQAYRTPARPAACVGWITFLGALLVHLVGVCSDIACLSGFALIAAMIGWLLLRGGTALLQTYWFPVVGLIFMVPAPMAWLTELGFVLKMLAAAMGVWIITALGVSPAVLDGSSIYLPSGPAGESGVLIIDGVCGGLRSLVTLPWIAFLLAGISQLRWPGRIILFLLAIPVAIGWNVVRITAFVSVASRWGAEAVAPNQWLHTFIGLVTFCLAVVALLAAERFLVWIFAVFTAVSRENHARDDDGIVAQHTRRVRRRPPRPTLRTYAPLAVLLCVALAANTWASRETISPANAAAQRLPSRLTINGITFSGRELAVSPKTQAVLGVADLTRQGYRSTEGTEAFEAALLLGHGRRSVVHSPEVCLEGAGEVLVKRANVHVTGVVPGPDGNGRLEFREVVSRHGAKLTYHLYTYRLGAALTPSFTRHRVNVLVGRLFGRHATESLIRISTPVTAGRVAPARELAFAAIRGLWPHLTEDSQ